MVAGARVEKIALRHGPTRSNGWHLRHAACPLLRSCRRFRRTYAPPAIDTHNAAVPKDCFLDGAYRAIDATLASESFAYVAIVLYDIGTCRLDTVVIWYPLNDDTRNAPPNFVPVILGVYQQEGATTYATKVK